MHGARPVDGPVYGARPVDGPTHGARPVDGRVHGARPVDGLARIGWVMWLKLIFIAGGGAVGSVLRYVLSGWGQRLGGSSFPAGTLTVNVAGCLLIGLLGAAFTGPWLVREEYRLAVMVGVLGGLTTFSSYSYETFTLSQDGQAAWAFANVALSNGLGLGAVWLGYRLGQRWLGV